MAKLPDTIDFDIRVQGVPAGYKLVPIEINEDMHAAAVRTIVRCTGNDDFPRRVWRAMLEAAPNVAVGVRACSHPLEVDGQPLRCQHCAAGVQACVPADDAALLDHVQRTGSTVELLPGNRFRVGGAQAAVSSDLRDAIRIAMRAHGVKGLSE